MMPRWMAWLPVLLLFPLLANGQDRHGCRVRREYDQDCTNDILVSRRYIPAGPVCVGQTMTFRAPWEITDHGASYLQVTEYTNPDKCPPLEVERRLEPVATKFEWELFWTTNRLASGSGPLVSHIPQHPGTYTCKFKATLPRACDPPKWEANVDGEALQLQMWAVWSNVFVGTNLIIQTSGGATGWQSSDTNIATVRDGVVFGISNGLVTITATNEAGCVAGMEVRVLELRMALDGNMDGEIRFDSSDNTNYVFWINNDYDEIHYEEFDWHEDDKLDPRHGIKRPNSEDSVIGWRGCLNDVPPTENNNYCLRDLEDFSRLHILVDGHASTISNLTYWLRCEGSGNNGAPEINIFPASRKDQKYLVEPSVAEEQAKARKYAHINGEETQISNSIIRADGSVTPFIFEGVNEGHGKLLLTAKHYDTEVFTVGVDVSLVDVTNCIDWYKVDNTSEHCVINTRRGCVGESDPLRYALFVHGFNVNSEDKLSWPCTLYKRLWWQGYRGRLGFFDWPCKETSVFHPHCYDASDKVAYECADELADLLKEIGTLYGSDGLSVYAHSQGNVLVGEALRISTSMVAGTYIASQAAVPAAFYQQGLEERLWYYRTPDIMSRSPLNGGNPYMAGVESKAGRRYSYYNRDDYALTGSWFFSWEDNNRRKPNVGYWYKGDIDGWSVYDMKDAEVFFYDPYPFVPPGPRRLSMASNSVEILSYIAESRYAPLGIESNIDQFTCINLKPMGYDNKHYSHSRQFRSNIAEQWMYWDNIFSTLMTQ